MIQQPRHSLTDEAVQQLQQAFPDSHSGDVRVVWWDAGGHLEEIVEQATIEMDIGFRTSESFPLDLRYDAVAEEREMDRPVVWYISEAKDDRDWFREVRETGGEINRSIEQLTADLYEVNPWDIFDVERFDDTTRQQVADLIKKKFNTMGTPQYDSLKQEILTRGGGQLLDHLLRDGWPEISRDSQTVAEVRGRLGTEIPLPDDADPDTITKTVRRWAVAQSLNDSGIGAEHFPEGYGDAGFSPLTDLLKLGGNRASADEYLTKGFWPDVIEGLDDIWDYADCPVDGALDGALWSAWYRLFEDSELTSCIEHAQSRQTALEVYPEGTGWQKLWAQCEHLARLELYFEEWDNRDQSTDPFSLYADEEDGSWRIDNEVLRLQLTGTPEESLPSSHPAIETLPEIRGDKLTTRYREYLSSLAEAVEAAMQVGNPLIDKPAAYKWWTDHEDEFDKAGTVAIFLIDALRFDLAQQLAEELSDTFDVSQETRVSTLPSETKFGMAALTPGRAFRFAVGMENETLTVSQGERSLSRKKLRKNFLSEEGWAVPEDLENNWSHSRIAYYDKEIDEVGESEIGEIERHFDDYVTDLADTIRKKIEDDSWDRIYVATDHGFVLLPEGTTTEAVDSSAPGAEVKYRRVAGDDLSNLTNGVHIPSNTPGLDYLNTDLQLLVNPRQYFSKQGYDGDRYYHGGLLPQECMLSFLEIKK